MIKLPLLAKCVVYPKGRWFYFNVYVWKRRKDMQQALQQGQIADVGHCEAICVSSITLDCTNRSPRMTGCIGQIHFHSESFMVGIITHECGHAALAWARRVGVDLTEPKQAGDWASNAEEAFCWVLGNLARQVVLKVNRQWKFPATETKGIAYT